MKNRILFFFLPFLFLESAHPQNTQDLQSQVEALLSKVKTLEDKLAKMEKEDDLTIPPPQRKNRDPFVRTSQDKLRVTMGGQVNRVILFADDGQKSRTFHGDNDSSPTRLYVESEGDLNPQTRVGGVIEAQLESNSTGDIDIQQSSPRSSISIRKAEGYIKNQNFGSLYIGQGASSGYGTMGDTDFSMTDNIVYGASEDIAGGLKFRGTKGQSAKVGDVLTSMDGLGRINRIRYDTPTFHGFSLSGTHGEKDSIEGALRWSYEGDVKILSALHGGKNKGHWDQMGYAMAVLFPQGFNFNFGLGKRLVKKPRNRSPYTVYGKIGYRKKWFSWGETAISLDFDQSGHVQQDGDRARAYGISLAQEVMPLNSQVYLGTRWYSLDRKTETLKNLFVVVFGVKLKF